jgi:hypothetical protein
MAGVGSGARGSPPYTENTVHDELTTDPGDKRPASGDLGTPLAAWIALVLLVAAAFTAWSRQPVEFDDAYISYRYAAHLASGEGLVFNLGERVEGYSNFLWVLVIAAGESVGLDAPHVGRWLGIACYLAIVILAWSAVWTPFFRLHLSGAGRIAATAVLAILITAHGLAATAGAGLETHAFALLILTGGLALARGSLHTVRSLTLIGVVPVLLFLTRPDGILPGAAVLAVVVVRSAHERSSWSIGLLSGAIAALPALATGVLYAIFKLVVFGRLVPNPYYAKGAGELHLDAGLAYLLGFVRSYPFVVVGLALIAFAAARASNEAVRRLCLYAASTSLVYVLFVVKVGGDFMEYRLGLHILPTIVAAAAVAVSTIGRRWWVGAVCAVVLVSLSLRPPVLETRFYMQNLEEMNSYAEGGRRVGAALAHLPPETAVATTLIGTIGYDSGLRIVDQWGLVDPEARHRPARPGFTRGHVRYTDWRGSRQQGAHLFLDHPHFCPCTPDCIENLNQILIATADGECVRAEVLIRDPGLIAALCADPVRFPVIAGRMCDRQPDGGDPRARLRR